MKPIDFYNAEPISSSNDLWDLYFYLKDFIDELEDFPLNVNNRITIKWYINESYDNGNYSFEVFSVWLDNKAIAMILKDHISIREVITNEPGFKEMLDYIESLRPEKESVNNVITHNEEDDISALDIFRNRILSDYYVKDTCSPKYIEGDIVLAEVKENHLRDQYSSNPKMIETRCLITKVHKFNPNNTYSLKQIDRTMKCNTENKYEPVEVIGKGDLFASGNDKTIKGLIGTDISFLFNSK